ncbi:MAG TPA: hypothetical protein VNW97_22790 [Candidatus Saccharimonadales bacterium]|jgi:hypothetical protein|nr:hypothetical protein [Candidatus Saccharimonadales bacterium]
MNQRTRFGAWISASIFACVCLALPLAGQVMRVNQEVKHAKTMAVRDMPTVNPDDLGVPSTHAKREAQPVRRIPVQAGLKPGTQVDPVHQQTAPFVPAALAPAVGLGFEGLGNGTLGFTPNAAPPDTNGAVGATQYVQWVNESFAVFDKATGAKVAGPTAGNTLFSALGNGCSTNNDGDPIAQYDKAASRWVLTQFSVSTTPFLQCVAVSTTSDATGAYNVYSFSYPNFDDYPKLSVWPDGYYITFNMFNGNTFVGADACAYDRAKMLAGQAATQICFQQGNSVGGLLPSDLDGQTAPPAGSPNFMVFFGTNNLDLFKFHVDFATPANSTFVGPTVIPVAAFSPLCGGGTCVPQPGTNQQLDSLGDRLMYRLAYRNFGTHESLVVNHSVVAGASGGVRWYELQNPNGTVTVAQQSTFAPDATFRWMGSVAMDQAGDLAVGYSKSSSTVNPSIAFSGRAATDPASTLQAETTVINGTGSQTGGLSRWGDYSAMTVDPVDDCTFWFTTEYMKTTGSFNWNTHIANFKFPNCGAAPDFSLSASPTSVSVTQGGSGSSTVTVNPSGGFTGSVSLSASGLPAGVTATFGTNPTTSTSVLTLTASSTAATGTSTVTITGTSGALSHTTTVTLTVTAPVVGDFSITATPASQTVTAGAGTSYTATVAGSGGFAGSVGFSISGLPAGANATFNPASVSGSGSSTVSVTTSSTTPSGTFTLTITGTSGSLVHSTTVTLVVNPAPAPDFTIAVSPATLAVNRGTTGHYTVTITAQNGFAGTVNLSISGQGSRVTPTFNPTSVTGSGTSTLSVKVSSRATTGNRTLTITGTSGALTHSTKATLTIQ